jgi:hypothetical protein
MGAHPMGVHLTGIYLIDIYRRACYGRVCYRHVFLLGGTIDNFTNDLCAKLPCTRIRLALNSYSNSLPRSIP